MLRGIWNQIFSADISCCTFEMAINQMLKEPLENKNNGQNV